MGKCLSHKEKQEVICGIERKLTDHLKDSINSKTLSIPELAEILGLYESGVFLLLSRSKWDMERIIEVSYKLGLTIELSEVKD